MTRRLILIFVLVASTQAFVNAQTSEPTPQCVLCPPVMVSCPTDIISLDKPMSIAGNISGGDPNAIYVYQWELSAGTILSGQGTSMISVEFVPNENITATLTVGGPGIPNECNRTASCTFAVFVDRGPLKADEFASLERKNEELRLTKFAGQLLAEPSGQAYIIAYGEKKKTDSTKKALVRMKAYLVKRFKFVPDRIVTVDGGLRQKASIELWLVPAGATPPSATPTVPESDSL